MRIKNRWFTLVLLAMICIITGVLMFNIEQNSYPLPIQQSINSSTPVVVVAVEDVCRL